jgi:prepilin-type N-terminal cleavage/methylation domain-containing protein
MSRRLWNRRARGYTLLELMVTMGIAASLMGVGVGAFLSMGKRSASENALASIQSTIVGVRNSSSRFPAMLVVDPKGGSNGSGSVQGLAQEVRQELHFDPRAVEGKATPDYANGIEGLTCDFMGNTPVPTGGRVGGALQLSGGKIDCGTYAPYDVTDGLTVELWMKPTEPVAGAELVAKGEAMKIRLEGANRITASVTVKAEHGDEKVSVTAVIPPVRPNQWTGVRLSYDRTRVVISTNVGLGFVERGSKDESRRLVTAPDASLVIGGFIGLLDDVRMAGVHSTEPVSMPQGVKLVGEKPLVVHFRDGRLDPASHMGSQRIAMEYAGRRTTLEIAINGMLSVAYSEAAQEAAPSSTEKPTGPGKKE